MTAFLTAIALGFLGSFHCIGMCGPIALALPVHHFKPLKKHAGIWLYQLGRLFTYAMLGLLFGLLGQAFFPGAFQQGLSVAIGLLMLLALILGRTAPRMGAFPVYRKFMGRLKFRLSQMFHKRGLRFLFLTGVLNGLLPCGLVYIGIAGAAASGDFRHGAFFMLGFGLGTIPAMYGVAVAGQFVSSQARNQLRKAMPVVITAMAFLLIVRGLNLGIPYLSPEITKEKAGCHVPPLYPKSHMKCTGTNSAHSK